MLRSYGNVIILYADECYAIKPEVNYLMSKVECQVSLHTFSIPPSLFLTNNIFNVFPTMKFKLFQLICKNIVETFIFQYHRNNIHTFYCMVFEGRVCIFSASPLFYYKKWRVEMAFLFLEALGDSNTWRFEPTVVTHLPLRQSEAASLM